MINSILEIQNQLENHDKKNDVFYNLVIEFASEIYMRNNLKLLEIYPFIEKKDISSDKKNSFDYIHRDANNNQNYIEVLSSAFLQLFTKEEQKDIGIFFTNNDDFLNCLFDNTNLNNVELEKVKILEPAVGAGAFVLPIIKQIVLTSVNKNCSEMQNVINNISENLYCVDLNPLCVLISEILIVLELLPLCKAIRKSNPQYKMPKLTIINGDYLTLAPTFKCNFDYVIGNPPYVTMYGRRSRGMTEEKRKFYNENFDFVINKKGNNKFNLCMFFVELALKGLKNHGKLSFILDISFFETAYIDLRKYILENSKVLVIDMRNSGFDNVASGQFILTVEKENSFCNCQENEIVWHTNEGTFFQKQYEIYNEKNKYKFVAPLDVKSQQFLSVFSGLKTLKTICNKKELRTCCALTGKTEEFLVRDGEMVDCRVVPYLEGSKGVAAKFSKPMATKKIKLDYDLQIRLSNEFKEELEKQGVKNKKRVTLGNMDAYFYPKLFIRQCATELVATYTEEPYAANNSLYILTFMSDENTHKNLLKYLCGLLNSEIMSRYAIETGIIRMSAGKTPQIKISDLLMLPVAISDIHFSNIVSLVEERLQTSDEKRKKRLDYELNTTFEQIYNL